MAKSYLIEKTSRQFQRENAEEIKVIDSIEIKICASLGCSGWIQRTDWHRERIVKPKSFGKQKCFSHILRKDKESWRDCRGKG